MDKGLVAQSLVRYLDQAHHPFVLKLAFPNQPKVNSENPSSPFVILQDSDPLTRVFMAKVVTDTGDAFKDIFLLTQRDSYPQSVPAIQTLTNKAVDALWQKAFRLHSDSGGSSIILSANLKEDGTHIPFGSLFYCAFRDLFFHPPCPGCGSPLDLCRADEMLEAGGLSPYSSSLDRYLYCPSCNRAGASPDFYVDRKRESDPPSLLDARDLIGAFGGINDDVSGSFPCVACPEKGSCYGGESKALKRIFPFSFFPFYLLTFEAYPAHAMDFLGLVSGKSPEAKVVEPPKQKVSVPEEPPAKKATPSKETEVAITKLLVNIREKWQAELKRSEKAEKVPEEVPKEIPEGIPQEVPQQVVEAEVKPPPEPVLEKTMIFSPGEMEAMSSTGKAGQKEETPPTAPPKPPAREIQLEKTMIFSPDAIERATSTPPPKPPGSGDQVKKTVIQAPDTKKDEETKPAKPEKKAEIIPETIIMPLEDLKGKKRDE